ncbi:protocadherin gamma-B4-like [Rhinoderma darwinii]|uniref:protocadherin gamma-B4-like n=1 Tax=Rhinoderma darwinii TaxID=43563 RepID=UPI003F678ED3
MDSLRQKIVALMKDNGVPSPSSTVTLNLVAAENFLQVVPEIRRQPNNPAVASNTTFYLVIAIALISLLFIGIVLITVIFKCRETHSPTCFRAYNRNVYPQFTLGCPSEISDTSLPFPFSYDVCVTMDLKQNKIAYQKPVQNVPTENLIDTGNMVLESNIEGTSLQTTAGTASDLRFFITVFLGFKEQHKTFLLIDNMAWQVICLCFILYSVTTSNQLHYSILEEMKINAVVGNLVKDLGLNTNELEIRKLRIVSHNKNNYFNVSLENGNLYVSDRVDREELCGSEQSCFMDLEILAENPVNVYPVKVEIQDINDNSPIFSKDIYEIGISESAFRGERFVLGNARDSDIGINSLQSYNLSPNPHFSLGEKTDSEGTKHPELILEQSLDREKQQKYTLILTASDGGKPLKTGTAVIKISVQDVNDNFPVFNQDIYRTSLQENSPVGSLVLHLSATDKDEGSYAEITYSFSHIPEKAHSVFSLDSETGVIKTKGELDFELMKSYDMTVEAADGGGLVAKCTVIIQIVDVNDNAPEIIILSLLTPIPEDSAAGTLVALINIKDLDSGANGDVTCQISETGTFTLMPSSNNYYKIITASHLDREINSTYNITVTAEDEGHPSILTKKTIYIIISDINDNPPLFDKLSYITYVSEHTPAGTSMLYVHASDPDDNENAKVIYSIMNTYIDDIPITSYVSINSMTGVLYAQRSFDYEQLREFQFQVMAKDSGSPPLSSNVTVRICIIDKNDNAPKILYPSPDTEGSALYEFIPHSAEKGYLVTKVIAVDADSGHNAWLSYHLLQVPDPSLFIIGQYTGEIRIGRNLPDMDSLRQKIVVLVKDNGVPSLSSSVTITMVVAENFQQVLPEIKHQPNNSYIPSNATFYLVIAIALISLLFIITVLITVIFKCRKSSTPPSFGTYSRNVYPQFTLGCPSEISDTSLPFPFSYDVCVTMDSKQNEIAYLKPVQNVPTENLIDTGDSAIVSEKLAGSQITQICIKVSAFLYFTDIPPYKEFDE